MPRQSIDSAGLDLALGMDLVGTLPRLDVLDVSKFAMDLTFDPANLPSHVVNLQGRLSGYKRYDPATPQAERACWISRDRVTAKVHLGEYDGIPFETVPTVDEMRLFSDIRNPENPTIAEFKLSILGLVKFTTANPYKKYARLLEKRNDNGRLTIKNFTGMNDVYPFNLRLDFVS